MHPVLFILYLTITTLFNTLTSAHPLDLFDRNPTNAPATIPDDNTNGTITTSSNTAVDTSKWVLTYCNKPYDPGTGACTGRCTTWKVADHEGSDIGSAADTNCIYTSPPFQVIFKACAGITGGFDCHWSDDLSAFHPWLYPDGDENGVSVYNTISTGEIELGPFNDDPYGGQLPK